MNWLQTGEITNITLSIAYKNGDVIKTDFSKQLFPSKETEDTLVDLEIAEDSSCSPGIENNNDVKTIPKADCVDMGSHPETSSSAEMTINIKPSQRRNIVIGAYVFATEDILLSRDALPHAKICGIVLSHSEDKITLMKHIGTNITAVEAIKKNKDGWRFLTYQECEKLVQYKEKLNIKLAELKRKQINDSVLLLYKDEKENQLFSFNISTRKRQKALFNVTILQDRIFSVYMVKDVKII